MGKEGILMEQLLKLDKERRRTEKELEKMAKFTAIRKGLVPTRAVYGEKPLDWYYYALGTRGRRKR